MKNPTRAPAAGVRRLLHRLRGYGGNPLVRQAGRCGLSGLVALVLSAAAAGTTPLPLALGFLACLSPDWTTLAGAAGCCAGYLIYWGPATGLEPLAGVVAVLLASALFAGTELRRRFWFMPALCGAVTGVLGLVFLLRQAVVPAGDFAGYALRVGSAMASAALFAQAKRKRGTPADWCVAAMLVLGLSQVVWFRVLDLGLAAAALITCAGAGLAGLPLAALCGLAVDLSQITPVPITPVLCLSLLVGALPFRQAKFLRLAGPALWSLPAMYLAGAFDPYVLLGLGVGGAASALVPSRLRPKPVQAPAKPLPDASARLEVAAGVLGYLQELLLTDRPVPLSQDAAELYDQAAEQVCRGCTHWEACWEREAAQTYQLLSGAAPRILEQCNVAMEDLPGEFLSRCRRPEAFLTAVNRALDGLRTQRRCRARLQEGRQALCDQYGFLSGYLRDAAQALDQPTAPPKIRYRPDIGISAAGKFGLAASGDRGAHFPGPEGRYYVILCDGMGTGLGAAQESESALRILTGLLRAGLPAEAALDTLNDLYVLRECGGFSTADVLELRLDTGRACLYKWGAAPTYLKQRHYVKKIGTAAPPPGLGIGDSCRAEVIRLSLQRGETVVLVSDGLEGEETQSRIAAFADQAPRALAAHLVASAPAGGENDRTAVAVCLRSLSPPTQ